MSVSGGVGGGIEASIIITEKMTQSKSGIKRNIHSLNLDVKVFQGLGMLTSLNFWHLDFNFNFNFTSNF